MSAVTAGRRVAALAVAASAMMAAREAGAVQGGGEDRSTTHAVAIARGTGGARSVECSGTLVSANVVLGVRHCFTSVSPAERPCDARLGEVAADIADDLWVNVSPSIREGAIWKKVDSVRVPEPTALCGDDIALLVLAEPVAMSEAVPARPVTDEATFHRAVEQRVLGLAAFGVTDPRASDLGTRRSRYDIPIRCVRGVAGFTCDAYRDFTSDREITSGGGPCRGDSGGGAIALSDHGVVFGVLSRGSLGAEGTSCALGVFERTDLWAWFIARTVIDAASEAAPAPAWATALFPASARPGELCVADSACGPDAACVTRDGRRSFVCVARCVQNAYCGEGSRCEDGTCAPALESAAPAAGCSTGGRAGVAPTSVLVALVLAGVSARTGRRDRGCGASSRSSGRSPARRWR